MGSSKKWLEEIAQELETLLGGTATMQALYEVNKEEGDKDAQEKLAVWSSIEDLRGIVLKLTAIVTRLSEVAGLDEIEDKLGK